MADILSLVVLCIIMSIAVPPQGRVPFFLVVFKNSVSPRRPGDGSESLYSFDYLMTTGNVFSINISVLYEHFLRKQVKETAGFCFDLIKDLHRFNHSND